ncbi:MAG: peptidoglycan DD-metalloendopeptidase family protein [Candidatus Polarisedimenticolia bacterium]
MTPRRIVVAGFLVFSMSVLAHADVTHTVRPGQTLFSIARSYGVSVEKLARANDIKDTSHIEAGRRLIIPGGKSPSPKTSKTAPKQVEAVPATVRAALAAELQWPLQGPVISGYAAPRRGGERHHKGIDIKADPGEPIRAAADGVVVRAEEQYGAYGRLVTIDHGEGVISFYGHNSLNLVAPGQKVLKGEVIARVGRTGNASVDHLHFEVRVKGQAVNPARVLGKVTVTRAAAPAVTRARRAEPARALYPREAGKGPPPE